MRDQFNDSFKRDKRLCSPIDGNEGKELMLDCIPFAGRRRVMGHRNGQVFLVGQLLQLFLPQTISRSVGTDRKSTRLNSSHRTISYAVFCLKKKKKIY